jgi:hypothetical protein
MTEPTALDVAQAIVHHMMQTRALSESQTAWCERFTHEITQALTAARAEGVAQERARCVTLMHSLPLTASRVQLAAALAEKTP